MRRKLSTGLLALLLSALLSSACGPATIAPTPLPTEADAGEGVVVVGPAAARDTAISHLANARGQGAPPVDLSWTEENLTQEGLVGASTFQYTTDGWIVTVSFPVVAPQATIYHVVVENEDTAFLWEGEVDAQGQVTETSTEAGQQGTLPKVSETDMEELVNSNNTFAFDLYQALYGGQGNLFYSPYSVSLALAMTYAGARGDTEAQMADTLHFLLPQERLHPSFQSLASELASRGQGAKGKDGKGFRLNIVNTLWGQEGYQFLSEFLHLLGSYYGAGLRPLDFIGNPEEARAAINDWVSEQTEGRIEDLIPPGAIDTLTRLVLTNAVYFNAAWSFPFEPEMTQDGPFHLLDGSEVAVPLMHQTESYPYADGDGYQAVELFYDGNEMSMAILLPAEGEFEAFEGTLDAERVEAILQDLGRRQVALTLPRFEFESAFSLVETLAALGMPDAFSSAADFSGMTGNRELFISEVVHKAFVSVDEAGTEAAAATAVMMALTSAQVETVDFNVDRPFLFLIRDVQTGTILFIGRVLDPSV